MLDNAGMKLIITEDSIVDADRRLAMLPNEANDNEARLLFDTGQEVTITKRTAQALTGMASSSHKDGAAATLLSQESAF